MAAIYGQNAVLRDVCSAPSTSGRATLVSEKELPPVIPDEINRLMGAVDALNDAVGLLMSRTASLADMSPQSGQPTQSCPPERAACEVAAQIRAARERVQLSTESIVRRCYELQV